MAKRESRRRLTIIKALEAEGWLVDSNPAGPSQRKGRSDLTVCAQGLLIAVEVKVEEDDKPTAPQVRYLIDVRRAGGLGFVTRDARQAVDTIKRWLQGQTMPDLDFSFLDDALKDLPVPGSATVVAPDLNSWDFNPDAAVEQDEDGNVRLVVPDRGEAVTVTSVQGNDVVVNAQNLQAPDPFRDWPPEVIADMRSPQTSFPDSLFAPGATGPIQHTSPLPTPMEQAGMAAHHADGTTEYNLPEMVDNAEAGLSLTDEGAPVPHRDLFVGFGLLERLEWKLDELCRSLGYGNIVTGERPTVPPGLRAPTHTSVETEPVKRRGRGPGRPKTV